MMAHAGDPVILNAFLYRERPDYPQKSLRINTVHPTVHAEDTDNSPRADLANEARFGHPMYAKPTK